MDVKHWLFLLFLIPMIGFTQTYISNSDNHLVIGNPQFQWTFSTDSCILRPLTYENKLSRNKYALSGPLFSLALTLPGEGITPPEVVPQVLTNKNFIIDKIKIQTLPQGKRADIYLSGATLQLIYSISINNNSPVSRIDLKVSAFSQQYPFLEKLSVLKIRFKGMGGVLGGFGQPVYGRDLFIGVEFPAAYAQVKNEDNVECWHYVAQNISQTVYYHAHTVAVGATRFARVQKAFFAYIKSLRPRPDDPFVLYNTWYDVRNFNYKSLLNTIQSFKKILVDRYGLKLDAFVLDDGWDNVHSVWEIDRQKLPQGFTPLRNALAKMHSALGLWISPWNGYDQARDKRVKWAQAHGFKTSAGRHLCLGDTAYYNIFKQKVLQYQKQAHLSFYKIDGFLSICNETTHNHLPGIYSRELLTRRFIEILTALRRQNPNIFIDITVGTWLSPYWLHWADAVWMTGADYGHADDVPAFSERDKAITFRDFTLYKDFVSHRYQFPLTNVMTHGIIKGKLNLLGGKDETLQNWMDNAVMYFSRGVMMWELYLSPQVLSPKEWDVLATVMKWANARIPQLQSTKFIGGNPYKRQIYGYVHQGKDQTLIILRNPFVRPQTVSLTLNELFAANESANYVVDQEYPQQMRLSQIVKSAQPLTVHLQGYEVQVLRCVPLDAAAPLPSGVSLLPKKISKDKVTFKVYLDTTRTINTQFQHVQLIKHLKFNRQDILPEQWPELVKQASNRSAESTTSPYALRLNNNDRREIGGQLIPQKKSKLVNGRLAILMDLESPLDSLTVLLRNGDEVIRPRIKKSANGIWYWILIPEQQLKGPLSFQLLTPDHFPKGQLSIWQIGRVPLLEMGRLTIETTRPVFDTSPRLPLRAASKRITRSLFTVRLNQQ